jgi:hypothetical protein
MVSLVFLNTNKSTEARIDPTRVYVPVHRVPFMRQSVLTDRKHMQLPYSTKPKPRLAISPLTQHDDDGVSNGFVNASHIMMHIA